MSNRALKLIVCGISFVLTCAVKAQPLVSGPTLELSESFGSFPRQVALGDANGDGALDLLVEQGVIFLADGTGGYDAEIISVNRAVALADLNGDGFDDIVSATSGRQLVILLGAADNQFDPGPSSGLQLADLPWTIEIGDFDGNGNRDVAVMYQDGQIELFLNDGTGALTIAAGIEFEAENLRLSTSGDINADGIDDIGVVDPFARPNQIRIFLGDGSGSFSEAPGSPVQFSPTGISSTQGLAFEDMNNDGLSDLVALSLNISAVGVFAGDGAGNFAEISGSPFQFASSDVPEQLAIGDMNADGTPDVVTANRVRSVSVMANAGDGSLAEIAESPFPAGDSAGFVSLGDLDSDGNLDAVTANIGSNDLSILLGDGNGVLAPAAASPIVLDVGVTSPMLRDMNGDNFPDIMFLRESQDEFVFAPGEGEGGFGELQSIQVGDRPSSIAIGDLNSDANLDVLVGLREGNDRPPDTENGDIAVLLGDGVGGFTKIPQAGLPENFGTIDVAITEFDGSAPPDIFVRNGSGIQLFSGNGDGTFSDAGLVPLSRPTIAIDVLSVDVDNDGWPDIVTSNQNSSELSVFLGSGSATFNEAPFSPVALPFGGLDQIISGDFNDDGFIDLVTGSFNDSLSILLNTGGSGFDISEILPNGSGGARIGAGDFDADGNLDLVYSDGGSRYGFLLGNGAGGFSLDPAGLISTAGSILDFSVAALDNDTADDAIYLQRAFGFGLVPDYYEVQSLLSTRVGLQFAPGQLDFGQIDSGSTSAAENILLSSVGQRSLEIGSVTIVGSDSTQFAIEQDQCSGQVLAPGSDCAISIRFSPLTPGVKSAELEISSNAETSPDTVALNGEGVNPLQISATPATVLVGSTSAISVSGGLGSGMVSLEIESGEAFCSLDGSTLTALAEGECTVTATKAADGENPEQSDTVLVRVVADAGVNLVVEIDQLPSGLQVPRASSRGQCDEVGFRIRVINNGPAVADEVEVEMPFPSGLLEPVDWSCAVADDQCTPESGSGAIDTAFGLAIGRAAEINLTGCLDPTAAFVDLRVQSSLTDGTLLIFPDEANVNQYVPVNENGLFRSRFE